MPSLVSVINEDMKQSMRSGDTFRRDTLRFLTSALKNAALEKRVPLSEFPDEAVCAVLRRGVKQREDSIGQYRSGGRPELAEKEARERDILAAYLPAAPDASAIRLAVEEAIAKTGATSRKDMGKVMGTVMKTLANASGDEVRRIAETLLQP